MIHMDTGSEITWAIGEPGEAAKPRRGMSWLVMAFGFLVAGLVGGTILFGWRPDWVWPFPVAGFVGYVLAFRRGMLLWNPIIDRTWRQCPWLDGGTTSEEGQPGNGMENSSRGPKDHRVFLPEPPESSRRELRVVR